MTGIVKTDQIQGAQGTTVTVPTGNTLAVTSNATVGGTLGVTGNTTMGGTAAITGNTTVGGTLVNTGLITASAGVAIGGTGSANTLDDYEEGTFTPSWNGYASPHATSGSYTKIGNAVSVYVELVTANVTDTSEVQIDNLPFTISGNRGGGIVWHNRTSLYPYDILTVMNANTTGCKLNTVTASSNVVGVKYVDSGEPTLGGYTTLRWTIFYQTS